MKRILLIAVIAAFTQTVDAQCIPDLVIAATEDPGLYPTVDDGIDPGAFGIFYSQEFNIVTLVDTAIGGTTYTVDSVIVTLGDAPAGLTIDCNAPECFYNPGDSGCFVLSGTPTEDASTITINVNIYSNFFISPIPLPYQYDVNMVGIEENLDPNRFGLSHNEPNPFQGETLIVFNSARSGEEVDLKVFDILGKVVYKQKIESERGINKIKFNRDVPSGSYIYSISNGAETFTKKMMVK